MGKGKRGREAASTNKNKKIKNGNGSSSKNIKWSSSNGIKVQKLYISKILATDLLLLHKPL